MSAFNEPNANVDELERNTLGCALTLTADCMNAENPTPEQKNAATFYSEIAKRRGFDVLSIEKQLTPAKPDVALETPSGTATPVTPQEPSQQQNAHPCGGTATPEQCAAVRTASSSTLTVAPRSEIPSSTTQTKQADPSLHQLSQDTASAIEGVVPEGKEAVSKISIHDLALGTPVVGFDTGRIECTPRADKNTKHWCKSQDIDDTYHHGFVDVYKGKVQAIDFIISGYDHALAMKDFGNQIQTIENQYGPPSSGCYECGKVSWTFKDGSVFDLSVGLSDNSTTWFFSGQLWSVYSRTAANNYGAGYAHSSDVLR